MITHHLDDASLLALGSGTLNARLALAATAHVELCPRCREHLRLAERIGGALLVDQPPAATAEDGFDRCWGLIQADDRPVVRRPAPARAEAQIGLPRVLAELLPGRLKDLPWRRLTTKVARYPLDGFGAEAGWISLFRFLPGAVVPTHRHGDAEMSLVLQGSYSDELGQFRVGDIEDLEASDEHRPVVDSAEPCIALIATSGPIVFEGRLNRLGARLFGI
jgi:putative transcriptional regulator